ncbi:MAG TPA: glycosyl hydrolase 108 family protein, partial [Thermomicrobiales bacterium]|nr:glycosyl hydrolase 108 family protein [Thermomicrobiales bacterium]
MAAVSYEPALARLLAHEGGYSNHPSDPGGPTNFGITIADYRKYIKPDATAADVEAMQVGEAKTIYRKRYWDAMRCDDLPAGVDYAVFDYGVNSGTGRAGKVLRRCLRLADGSARITDEVIAATGAADARALIASICDERIVFLKSLKTWDVFGRGWQRRVDEVRTAALAMAAPPPPAAKPSVRPTRAAGAAAVSAGGAAHSAGLPLWATATLVIAAAVLAIVAVRF